MKAKFSGVYTLLLLFKEKVTKPTVEFIHEKLLKKFGDVDIVASEILSFFALKEYCIEVGENKIPSQIIISECDQVEKPIGDADTRLNFGENETALIDSCKWQIMIGDFLAAGHQPLVRANILADWLEVALELFPTCVAVYSEASGKLLTTENARANPYSNSSRFIHWGLNVRFFNVEKSNDKVIDTLGLYSLGLADVQYHFFDLANDDIVCHAYNTAIYQLENNAPIKSGDTIEGLVPNEKWKCQYEKSLVQPKREVLDIATGKNAAGKRS